MRLLLLLVILVWGVAIIRFIDPTVPVGASMLISFIFYFIIIDLINGHYK